MSDESLWAAIEDIRRVNAPVEPKKPRRAYVLKLELGANTKKDLVNAIYNFATAMDRGELSGSGVSGSPSSGWMYDLSVDESITKESYFAAIDAYLAKDASDG